MSEELFNKEKFWKDKEPKPNQRDNGFSNKDIDSRLKDKELGLNQWSAESKDRTDQTN